MTERGQPRGRMRGGESTRESERTREEERFRERKK